MKKSFVALCVAVGALLPASGFAATFLVSPYAPPAAEARFDFSATEVAYSVPDDRFEIFRYIESVSWGYQTFFATVGYVSETDLHEVEATQFDYDPGYVLAFGARGPVWCAGDFSVLLHAQFHTLNEKIVRDDASYSLQSIELLVGGDVAWTSGNWSLYAGIEGVPYSDISTSYEPMNDIERADFLIARVGGRVNLGRAVLDTEVSLIGAQGARVGLSYPF